MMGIETGNIIPVHSPHDALQKVAAKAGVPWKHNALRHSFASYHLALHGDAGKTATIMGHSVRMLEREYKDLKSPADAAAWFNVMPENSETNIPPGRKKSVDGATEWD
jgi:integrase